MLCSRSLTRHGRLAARACLSTLSSNGSILVGTKSAQDHAGQSSSTVFMAGAAALLGAALGSATVLNEQKHQKRPVPKYPPPEPNPVHDKSTHQADYNMPPERPDLPTIPLDEVREHADEDSMWFTFRGAVYDMTFFINGHPGGTPVRLSLCKCAVSCIYCAAVFRVL